MHQVAGRLTTGDGDRQTGAVLDITHDGRTRSPVSCRIASHSDHVVSGGLQIGHSRRPTKPDAPATAAPSHLVRARRLPMLELRLSNFAVVEGPRPASRRSAIASAARAPTGKTTMVSATLAKRRLIPTAE